MWQQWATNELQLPQTEPGERVYDPFRYFARRSREVHRQNEDCPSPAVPRHLPFRQYDDFFWDRILQRPGEELLVCDPSCTSSLNMLCSASADLVSGHKGKKGAGFCLEKLPSPTELMGRRRKKRGGRTQRRDTAQQQAAVTQHIGDLKRKQSFIDQMKGDKWWGSVAGSRPGQSCLPEEGELNENDTGFAIPTSSLVSMPSPSLPVLHSPPSASLFNQEQILGGCKELLDLAPGGNPMMSFVFMGTAYRGARREWGSPVPKSWGNCCNIEE